MRVTFIEGARRRGGLAWDSWYDNEGRFAMPSVGLLSMASLAREADEVAILDEKVSPIPDDLPADVVALSFKTMDASHTYALADRLRARGIRVILGGVHASLVPEVALAHADAVVVGEGEAILPLVLDDIERGTSSGIYRAPVVPAPLNKLPAQRVDLLANERYMLHGSQTARGCSFDCEFCPTRAIFGSGYRTRDADAVLDEAERMMALENKPVFFSENVFGAGDLPFVQKLTSGLDARGIRYGVFCDWLMLTDEIVEALAVGKCGLVCLNLTGREEPREIAALESVSRRGMPIWGYFMFGFEEDGPDVFDRAIERVRTYDIVSASMTVLTPFPGTPMGVRLEREGRIFSHDLDYYDHTHVHFEPKRMTARQLQDGFDQVLHEVEGRLAFARAADALAASR